MQNESLSRIVELTYIIAAGYPDAAAKLRQVSDGLKDTDGLPPKHVDDLKHAYRANDGECNKYVALVNELHRLALWHLPDQYADLKIVPGGSRWHDDDKLDWETARAELVAIRAAAAKAAALRYSALDGEPSEPARKEKAGLGSKRRPGHQGDRCPRGAAPNWILSMVCEHHEYDGQSIGNWTPFGTLAEVVAALDDRVGKTTAAMWFKKEFGGFPAYKAACQNETLLPKLQKLRGDFNHLFDAEEVLLNRRDPRAADPAHD